MNKLQVLNALSCLTNGALNYYQASKSILIKYEIIRNYIEILQSQLEQKEKILQELKDYCENDDVFRLPDLYSQSIADEIQKDLLSIIERSNSNE